MIILNYGMTRHENANFDGRPALLRNVYENYDDRTLMGRSYYPTSAPAVLMIFFSAAVLQLYVTQLVLTGFYLK